MQNQTVLKIYGPHDMVIPEFREDNHTFNSDTLFGIEVEIERVPSLPLVFDHWNITNDGSLRNNGVELISLPLRGKYVEGALKELEIRFHKRCPQAEFSHRCSIHVHIDVRNLTYQQLLVFFGFYLSVEKLFFKRFFPNREGNSFCYPLTSTMLTTADIQPRKLGRDNWKYAALNAHHLTDFGTLEFRHHPGTKSSEELLNWIRVINDIYEYARKTDLKDFNDILDNLNTNSGYVEYVRAALPNWNHPISPEEMYDSVTCAKYFLRWRAE